VTPYMWIIYLMFVFLPPVKFVSICIIIMRYVGGQILEESVSTCINIHVDINKTIHNLELISNHLDIIIVNP
jgi:hypothetical protein